MSPELHPELSPELFLFSFPFLKISSFSLVMKFTSLKLNPDDVTFFVFRNRQYPLSEKSCFLG